MYSVLMHLSMPGAHRPKPEPKDVVVIGGRTYRTATIGGRVWLAENLDLMQTVVDQYSYSTYRPGYETVYKRYYTWDATQHLELPPGWHLPSREDYEALLAEAGHDASPLKASNGWNGYEGTDSLRFSALPGCRNFSESGWVDLLCADFWTSTEGASSGMYYHVILNDNNTYEIALFPHATALLPIRLVKD